MVGKEGRQRGSGAHVPLPACPETPGQLQRCLQARDCLDLGSVPKTPHASLC